MQRGAICLADNQIGRSLELQLKGVRGGGEQVANLGSHLSVLVNLTTLGDDSLAHLGVLGCTSHFLRCVDLVSPSVISSQVTKPLMSTSSEAKGSSKAKAIPSRKHLPTDSDTLAPTKMSAPSLDPKLPRR